MFPAEGTSTDVLPVGAASAHTLRTLLDLVRGRTRPLIHLQHNPDPDALASALALQYLLKRMLDVECVLAYTGLVGRAENRAMLRWLKIQIVPSYKIDYAEHDFIAVLDTHPGAGTCRLPVGIVPHVVIDHHPARKAFAGVALTMLDTSYGSTSTMVGALLLENGIPLNSRIATALTYGIRTDTLDLARGCGPKDEAIYEQVFAWADKRVLGKIERARVTQEYFQVLENGLRRAQITDFAVTTWVGPVAYGDAVAEIADLLFRLEGTKWVLVVGLNESILYFSIRALQAEGVDAGAVAREIAQGHGGGHESYAGGQFPLPKGMEERACFELLRDRFLKAVRAKRSLTRPLTLPPDAPTPESVREPAV
jgi:nanoRNase/pAp phosphatase (c-di-AMP/oligoRNAs hydrolase)